MATQRANQGESIRRELSFIRREANRLEDYEAADALHKSVNTILSELEDLELRQPAATDDLPRAA